MIRRHTLAAYAILCLFGSVSILLFMELVRRIFGGPWDERRVVLALIVCAGFCLRAWMERRHHLNTASATELGGTVEP